MAEFQLRHTSDNNSIKSLYITFRFSFVPHILAVQWGQEKEIRCVPRGDKKEKF